MAFKKKAHRVTAVLATLVAAPLLAQAEPAQDGPPVPTTQLAAGHVKRMMIAAAEQMSEDDYAFQPTPEVRTFGQLLAHVADSNFHMCATAMGEDPPTRDVEKTVTARAEIQKALATSFAYCEGAYEAMTGDRAKAMVPFMGMTVPATNLLDFVTFHGLSHYGNVVVYMRLRGKVPPSSQPGALEAPQD